MSVKLGAKDLFPYLGDYRPVNIYKGENKIGGWRWAEQSGEELYFEDTYNDFVNVEIDGKSVQEGEPSPDNPIEIHSLNDFDVVSSTEKLTEGQLDEYDYDVEYEKIDKIYLLLNEPLRSVGDVKDRLFKDSDGLWKVERNVGEQIFMSSSGFVVIRDTATHTVFRGIFLTNVSGDWASYSTKYKSSHFIIGNAPEIYSGESSGMVIDGRTTALVYISIEKGSILTTDDMTGFNSWLSNNPVTILYQYATPTTENLDQEIQDKLNNLRSFRDSNYVYTTGSIEPHLIGKAKVKDV